MFFRHGQVLEAIRGQGIYQPSVDEAIRKLNAGDWVRIVYAPCIFWHLQQDFLRLLQVHLFGEGKVNQPRDYPPPGLDDVARLPRFKWGT